MSVEIFIAATLAVSGASAVYAFSRSLRKDVLGSLLSKFREPAALVASLVADVLFAGLCAVSFWITKEVTYNLFPLPSGESIAHTLGLIMKILLVVLVAAQFLGRSLALVVQAVKSRRAKGPA